MTRPMSVSFRSRPSLRCFTPRFSGGRSPPYAQNDQPVSPDSLPATSSVSHPGGDERRGEPGEDVGAEEEEAVVELEGGPVEDEEGVVAPLDGDLPHVPCHHPHFPSPLDEVGRRKGGGTGEEGVDAVGDAVGEAVRGREGRVPASANFLHGIARSRAPLQPSVRPRQSNHYSIASSESRQTLYLS